MRFVLVFTIRNACRAFFASHAQAQQKTSKNKAWEPPKPSPDTPEPSKIEPGVAQESKKTAKASKKWQRSTQEAAKEAPKSEKRRPRAKNEQTWRQHGRILAWRCATQASPRKEKQHVNAHVKAVGFNTPDAAELRGGLGSPRPSKIEAKSPKNRC